MLPLGRKPVLEYILDEVLAAGIEKALFVISPDRPALREYFGSDEDSRGCEFAYAIQEEQLGLGHAVLQAQEAVNNQPFAVALGDSVIHSPEAQKPFERLLKAFADSGAAGVILVQRTPLEEAGRYGIVKPKSEIAEPFEISDLIEKPSQEQLRAGLALDGEYAYAIAGRYAFEPVIFKYLSKLKPGAIGELQLTDAVRDMLADGRRVWCVPLRPSEKRRDIGTAKSYMEAFCAVAFQDPEFGDYLRQILAGCVKEKS